MIDSDPSQGMVGGVSHIKNLGGGGGRSQYMVPLSGEGNVYHCLAMQYKFKIVSSDIETCHNIQ